MTCWPAIAAWARSAGSVSAAPPASGTNAAVGGERVGDRLAADHAARDELALGRGGAEQLRHERRASAGDEEVDARAGDGGVAGVERDLLADDRREVGVEREQELLDVAALRVAAGEANAAAVAGVEHVGLQEAEQRVDAPSCWKPKPRICGPVAALLPGLTPVTAGTPNMPILVYMLRSCGTLTVCGMASKLISPSVPKKPSSGLSAWQPSHGEAEAGER